MSQLPDEYQRLYPLHAAVYRRDVAEVHRLIAAGADIDQLDQRTTYPQSTPLMIAFRQSIEISEILLRAGALCVDNRNYNCGLQCVFATASRHQHRSPEVLKSVYAYLRRNMVDGMCSNSCCHHILSGWSRIWRLKVEPEDFLIDSLMLVTNMHKHLDYYTKIATERRSEIDDHTYQRYTAALRKYPLDKAALNIMCPRMTEICIAMQDLGLPTLLMVLIIEEACWMAATEFRRYHTWTLAATVKHWREQLASKQPRKRRRVVRPISEDTDDM